jgi:hypothetical protein
MMHPARRACWSPAALAAIVPAALLASGAHYSERARSLYEAATSAQRLAAFAAIRPYLELPAGRFLIGGLDERAAGLHRRAGHPLVPAGRRRVPERARR